jgi:hypothetical protein
MGRPEAKGLRIDETLVGAVVDGDAGVDAGVDADDEVGAFVCGGLIIHLF